MTFRASDLSFRSPRSRRVAVVAVCFFAFFVHLGAPEASLMECRNLVTAREMAAGGSWLLPTMNGELRLAKPPLPIWAVAAVLRADGPTEDLAVLRLPAAGMATLLVLFFWGLSRELTRDQPGEAADPGRTAWLATMALASSVLMITSGREGQWDIFSTGLMMGCLWLLVRGWRSSGAGYGWFAGAGLLAGLSFLSKGPVALYAMLVPFVGVYASRRLHPGGGAALALHWRGALLALGVAVALGGAWPAYVLAHVAPAARAVAGVEITAWRERHVQPVWFYLSFPAFAGVWSCVALGSLAWPYARARAGRFVPYALGLGWLLASLLLLSLVPEKKVRYLLPVLPPLALLAGGLLRSWEWQWAAGQATWADRALLRAWAGTLMLLALLLPVAVAVPKLPGFGIATRGFWAAAVGGTIIAGVASRVGWQRPGRPAALAATALGLLGLLVGVLFPLFEPWQHRHDEPGLRRLAAARQNPAVATLPWFSINDFHITQVWRAGRPVPTLRPATLTLSQLPVVVVSSSAALPQLPVEWQKSVQAEAIDSFYVGRDRGKGRWLLTVLRQKGRRAPAPHGSRAGEK